ncbi:hypothetical protein [Paraburkholderia sp. Ac-20347]|nr:hypothetical protein [Paraburkholderia sp. Ac-20347]MBN3814174.1 hypothetical protein [Paraburkholderia sp. Ac-20347]
MNDARVMKRDLTPRVGALQLNETRGEKRVEKLSKSRGSVHADSRR